MPMKQPAKKPATPVPRAMPSASRGFRLHSSASGTQASMTAIAEGSGAACIQKRRQWTNRMEKS